MKILFRLLPLAIIALLTACAATGAGSNNTQSQLAAAGFQPRLADTAAKVAFMKKLPPYQLKMVQQGDKVVYAYSVPNQNFVYIGGPNEYAAYQTYLQSSNLANSDKMAADAQMLDDVDFDTVAGIGWYN